VVRRISPQSCRPTAASTVRRNSRRSPSDAEAGKSVLKLAVIPARICLTRNKSGKTPSKPIKAAREFEYQWQGVCPEEFLDTDPNDPRLSNAAVKKVLEWRFGSRGLLLHGVTARGKTRAVWLLLKQIMRDGHQFTAMSSMEFCRKSSDAAGTGRSEGFANRLINCHLLFIDDIGKGRMNERNAADFFDVLDQRFSRKRPVILTMNMVGDELAKRIDPDMGAPLLRRIKEFCQIIHFA
jgi:DNA replication protein DnaC